MGLGNKVLNSFIRKKIGKKVRNYLENNAVSIKDINKELYVPIKYHNSNINNFYL